MRGNSTTERASASSRGARRRVRPLGYAAVDVLKEQRNGGGQPGERHFTPPAALVAFTGGLDRRRRRALARWFIVSRHGVCALQICRPRRRGVRHRASKPSDPEPRALRFVPCKFERQCLSVARRAFCARPLAASSAGTDDGPNHENAAAAAASVTDCRLVLWLWRL